MFETLEQFNLFTLFLSLGLLVGGLYILIRFLMGKYTKKGAKILSTTADVLFCILSCAAFFLTNLYLNDGKFSLYIFFAVALGCFSVAKFKAVVFKKDK